MVISWAYCKISREIISLKQDNGCHKIQKNSSDIYEATDVTKLHYAAASMMEILEPNANVYGQYGPKSLLLAVYYFGEYDMGMAAQLNDLEWQRMSHSEINFNQPY